MSSTLLPQRDSVPMTDGTNEEAVDGRGDSADDRSNDAATDSVGGGAFGAEPPSGAAPHARVGLWCAVVLLLLGSLPDAMVPPVLRTIVVDRLGGAESMAHWFMSVNLIGAILAIPLLMWLRKRVAPTHILIGAALADAVFLYGIFLSDRLATALVLRGLEGVADLIVLAVLLDLVAKAGGARARGRRLGLGATTLLLGLGLGALVGARFGDAPHYVFLLGAGSSGLLALVAAFAARPLLRAVASCPVVDAMETVPSRTRRVTPVVCMMAGDRALAGVLTVTIPMLLAGRLGWSAGEIGWIIALPLLLMALLAWPAGLLGDRVGNLQLRAVAGLVYALALAALPAVAIAGLGGGLAGVIPLAVLLGIAAAALMPTTMALAARTGRGSVAMAAVHAGGNIGYLIGIVGGGALLAFVGGLRPDPGAFALVVVIFALAHVVITGMAALTMIRVAPATTPNRR